MCCRQLTSSWFLGWDWMMCVKPVRSAFGVVSMNFGAGAGMKGHRASRQRGPQQQWISSHITHIVETPRKWKLRHSPHSLQLQGYTDNGIWRTSKINQYHLSLEYFWGPVERPINLFFKLSSPTRSIQPSCDRTWRTRHPKPTDTCNFEFIDCFWFVFLCECSMLPANQD